MKYISSLPRVTTDRRLRLVGLLATLTKASPDRCPLGKITKGWRSAERQAQSHQNCCSATLNVKREGKGTEGLVTSVLGMCYC